MMERLPDGEAAEYGTALEEAESARTVAGFRRRLLVEHMVGGFH